MDDSIREIRKVAITYHMIRGNEVAESFINMPISEKRYDELAKGLQPEHKVWKEIRNVLVTLTKLQGYDELGGWNIELTIEI